MGRAPTDTGHKEIQVCRLSLCCQSRDTRCTLCKKTALWTQLADVYGRRRTSAKYHKTKTPKRHYERISRREREENNVLTCPLYLLGAITYDYKLYFVWMWYVLDMYHILFYMNYALFGITYYAVCR